MIELLVGFSFDASDAVAIEGVGVDLRSSKDVSEVSDAECFDDLLEVVWEEWTVDDSDTVVAPSGTDVWV
jgi:hypothetical protein